VQRQPFDRLHVPDCISPSSSWPQLRLRAARALLDAGRSPASVAVEVGFADQSHLTRWFVRSFGITPARYATA